MNRAARGLRAALESRYPAAVRIRGVELAESLDGGRLVAALDTSLAMPEVARLASLVEAAPGLSGLGVVVSGTARGSYVGLRGEPFVEAVVLGTRLRSHVMSFFQANRFLVGDLVRAVAELTPQGGTLLDLYAGVGLFSLCLAHRAGRVSGIESNDFAFEDARANAADAAADNVRFFHGDVLATLRELPPTEDERVILDPPRTGAGPGVVAAVASRRPAAVVYVSCDPPTLGRDLKLFADAGYRPDSVEAFDLFPDTFHLESVVRLARA
jgi:23S rRNA (uracil1939-C5)-methyltransferase